MKMNPLSLSLSMSLITGLEKGSCRAAPSYRAEQTLYSSAPETRRATSGQTEHNNIINAAGRRHARRLI